MKINKFSPKQAEILKFICEKEDTLICDGAVRSGKTIVMTLAFIIWAMSNFNKTNFGICGKTVSNAERNIIRPFEQLEQTIYRLEYKRSARCLIVRCANIVNYFYIFGGKDESSYTLIQGATLAGVLFDEAALMPKSFVDQAIARTLSFPNAKVWFNCNPESANHWFYKDWIKNKKPNSKRLHFLMTDNPILTENEIHRAQRLYSGVFYDRYIKGLWVSAEGIIYKQFADNPLKFYINKEKIPNLRYINVGVDFGGNKSKHAFCASGIDKDFKELIVLKSKSFEATGTNVSFISEKLTEFIQEVEWEFKPVDCIFCDSAEQAIINTLISDTPYGHKITNSIKNPIIDRIRTTDSLMAQGRFKMINGYNDCLDNALKTALWNEKKFDDERLDDGTTEIDILDAFEYSFEAYLKSLIYYNRGDKANVG